MAPEKIFEIDVERLADLGVPVINLCGSTDTLTVSVIGTIANSVPTTDTGKDNLASWKIQIASEVKAARGDRQWDSSKRYAISLVLKFCMELHGYRALDVDNFTKPIIDAIAAGLFCEDDTDLADIPRWNYDDSNFNTLLFHRLPDTSDPRKEGVAVHVSAT